MSEEQKTFINMISAVGEFIIYLFHCFIGYIMDTAIGVYDLINRKRKLQSVDQRTKQKALNLLINNADKRLRWSVVRIADALRKNEITSLEITKLYINHIRSVNPFLNAVAGNRFDEACAEASAADKRFADARSTAQNDNNSTNATFAKLPPLLGIPMISKEVFEYPGFPYTAGIWGRRGNVGVKKNPVLIRCEAAGAIVLCCGNVSEGCMWSESDNPVHGCSNNPYDILRTPGGSSGGNASIFSALGGAFAVTSDVGGSTRIPALYNGIFGHKPSGGAVPNARTIPIVHGLVERYCQLGPSVRHAEDLMLILRVLAGPIDPTCELLDADEEERALNSIQNKFQRTFHWPDPRSIDLKRKTRFFVMWDQPGAALGLVSGRHPDMLSAQHRAVSALECDLGVTMQAVKFDSMTKCFDIWAAMLHEANPVPFKEVISDGKAQINPLWETIRWLISWGRWSDHTLPALGLAGTEDILGKLSGNNANMIQLGEKLRDEINTLLGKDGVLIVPSLPNPAPFHGPLPNLLYFADYAACGIYNTLELPATHVPMGLTEKLGLPVGIQVIAANGNDHLTIATAIKLEELGEAGWIPPRI